MVISPRVTAFLAVGYLSMTKSFVYLRIPPLRLFIGEIVLVKPRMTIGTWAASVLRASPLNALGLAMLVFMLYGAWQMARGVLAGGSVFYTLKFFIFNYYALYLFFGIWVSLQAPDSLPSWFAVAWLTASTA